MSSTSNRAFKSHLQVKRGHCALCHKRTMLLVLNEHRLGVAMLCDCDANVFEWPAGQKPAVAHPTVNRAARVIDGGGVVRVGDRKYSSPEDFFAGIGDGFVDGIEWDLVSRPEPEAEDIEPEKPEADALFKGKPTEEWAQWFARKFGMRVAPLPIGQKAPPPKDFPNRASSDPAEIRQLFANVSPSANYLVVCDDFVVIDTDGAEGEAALLNLFDGSLPRTLTVTTGRGTHRYVKWPEGVARPRQRNRAATKLDIQTGRGAYVVGPPSVHPAGGHYTLDSKQGFEIATLTVAQAEAILNLVGGRANEAPVDPAELHAPEGAEDLLREIFEAAENHEGILRDEALDMALAFVGAGIPEDEVIAWTRSEAWPDNNIGGLNPKRLGWDAVLELAPKFNVPEELLRRARTATAQEEFEADPEAVPPEKPTASKSKKLPAAVALYRKILGRTDVRFFHGHEDKRPYIQVRYRNKWRTYSLTGSEGPSLLRHILSDKHAVGAQTFRDALESLKGYAVFEAPAREVFLRSARVSDRVYIDLGDDTYRVLEVTADGWSVLEEAPPEMAFVRGPNIAPLPLPEESGAHFRPFFATKSKVDLWLLLMFMCDTFAAHMEEPRPILVINGAPGSGKSTMTLFVKRLTDPEFGDLMALSKDKRDLVISARSRRVLAFDNAGDIPADMSDALCRLASGGGLRTRKLYTDDEEVMFVERRHVVLNSVGDVARKGDLRSRGLFINTEALDDSFKDELSLKVQFEAARPRLFGVILSKVATMLKHERAGEIEVGALPRMTGFARRAFACAPSFGLLGEHALTALQANVAEASQSYLDSDLVASVLRSQSWTGVRDWLRRRLERQRVRESVKAQVLDGWDERTVWRGSPADLLAYLEEQAGQSISRRREWPTNVAQFGRELRMIESALRRDGWEIKHLRTSQARLVVLRLDGPPAEVDGVEDPNADLT